MSRDVRRAAVLALSLEGHFSMTSAPFKVFCPITKVAAIDVTDPERQFLVLERKRGAKGFTLNYSTNLIPDGYRLESLIIDRRD